MISIPIKKILYVVRIVIVPFLILVFGGLILQDGNKSIMRNLEKTTDDGWEYIRLYDSEKNREFITITGYEGNNHDELEIPGEIEGVPVRVLKGHLFDYGYELKRVTIPNEVEEIIENVFDSTEIEEIVFEGGSWLKRIDGRGALSSRKVEELILPDSVEYISVGAFAHCYQLKGIYIGPNVREIGDGSFPYNLHLEDITVSEDNEYYEVRDGLLIDKSNNKLLSFDHVKYSEELIIPADIEEVDIESLDDTESISVAAGNEYYTSINGCLYTKDGKTLCRVPDRMEYEDFKWADGVEEIGPFAFRYCFFDERLNIPDSVRKIGFWAFDDQTLYISNTLESADFQGFVGTIHFQGTEEEWNKIYVINAAYTDLLEYDLIFEED